MLESRNHFRVGMEICRDLTDCELRRLLKLQSLSNWIRVLVDRLAGEIDSVRSVI
jgi:hypothetical protein